MFVHFGVSYSVYLFFGKKTTTKNPSKHERHLLVEQGISRLRILGEKTWEQVL